MKNIYQASDHSADIRSIICFTKTNSGSTHKVPWHEARAIAGKVLLPWLP